MHTEDDYEYWEEECDETYLDRDEIFEIQEDYKRKQFIDHIIGPTVSTIVHVILILLLIFFLVFPNKTREEEQAVDIIPEEVVEIEEPEEVKEIVEPEEVTEDKVALDTNISKVNAESESEAIEEVEDVLSETDDNLESNDISDIKNLDTLLKSSTLKGGSKFGGKFGAKLFGVKSKGRNFVFIIDYSASMKQDQLTVMKAELTKTLKEFNPKANIAMIFFSGPAWVAGVDPKQEAKKWDGKGAGWWKPKKGYNPPTPKWLKAEGATKRELAYHVQNTPVTFGTVWENPFKLAYQMYPKPDVIYFMTDGASKNPIETLKLVEQNKSTQVFTFAYGIPNEKASEPLKAIAEMTKGKFKIYTKEAIKDMAAKASQVEDEEIVEIKDKEAEDLDINID